MSGAWWRRNRGWLLLLPVALALLVLATSSRYFDFWRHQSFRERVAEVGIDDEVAIDLSEEVQGLRFRVRMIDVRERATVPSDYSDPEPPPEGHTVWVVTLGFSDASQDDVVSCNVVLVDAQGNRYGDERSDPWGQILPCEPTNEDLDEAARSWTATPFVLAPEDVEITEIWLTWGFSEKSYVALRVD